MKGKMIMNIDYMKCNNLEIKSLKQEIVDFSGLIKNVQDHGCTISDETFEKCRSYVQELQNKIKVLEDGAAMFLSCIFRLSNARYIQVILERYYKNKKWDDVASACGYSENHITKYIHPKAKAEFLDILQSVGEYDA